MAPCPFAPLLDYAVLIAGVPCPRLHCETTDEPTLAETGPSQQPLQLEQTIAPSQRMASHRHKRTISAVVPHAERKVEREEAAEAAEAAQDVNGNDINVENATGITEGCT